MGTLGFGSRSLTARGKNQKYVIPNPVRFLNGVKNLLFPWFSCEQQIPHPQTTRVRDDKSHFFRSLIRHYPVECDVSVLPKNVGTPV
jgi:hypothetical protein